MARSSDSRSSLNSPMVSRSFCTSALIDLQLRARSSGNTAGTRDALRARSRRPRYAVPGAPGYARNHPLTQHSAAGRCNDPAMRQWFAGSRSAYSYCGSLHASQRLSIRLPMREITMLSRTRTPAYFSAAAPAGSGSDPRLRRVAASMMIPSADAHGNGTDIRAGGTLRILNVLQQAACGFSRTGRFLRQNQSNLACQIAGSAAGARYQFQTPPVDDDLCGDLQSAAVSAKSLHKAVLLDGAL